MRLKDTVMITCNTIGSANVKINEENNINLYNAEIDYVDTYTIYDEDEQVGEIINGNDEELLEFLKQNNLLV